MKPYHHFTYDEYCCLFIFLKKGLNLTEIAKALGKDKSSVSRAIRRCPCRTFNAPLAMSAYKGNRKRCVRKMRIGKGTELYGYVREKLRAYWSPEIISLKWNAGHPDDTVSFQTIYRAVRSGWLEGIEGRTHLRRRDKKRLGKRHRFDTIHPDHTIRERPAEAEQRLRADDWEGDTLRSSPGKGCLATFVDRKSRLLLCAKSDGMSSRSVEAAVEKAFESKGIRPKSITLDNGSEFARFREIERRLGTTVYFADPHSPWQRGSNENINGCLRFFFPRGTDFRKIDDGCLQRVVDIINSRPRKCLGLRSPYEVYYCCT